MSQTSDSERYKAEAERIIGTRCFPVYRLAAALEAAEKRGRAWDPNGIAANMARFVLGVMNEGEYPTVPQACS